ncbi:hypothetical protein B0H34DRAFT_682258 [Crassisporium funariophilum]|nr:hypothetical protein B0H34DRAFT_682258 [Crassisporium funariophilum]
MTDRLSFYWSVSRYHHTPATLSISIDPSSHHIIVHAYSSARQFGVDEQAPSPGSSSNTFQRFIHNRLLILVLVVSTFVAELLILAYFYGPSLWRYIRNKKEDDAPLPTATRSSSFTRKPQRHVHEPRDETTTGAEGRTRRVAQILRMGSSRYP